MLVKQNSRNILQIFNAFKYEYWTQLFTYLIPDFMYSSEPFEAFRSKPDGIKPIITAIS